MDSIVSPEFSMASLSSNLHEALPHISGYSLTEQLYEGARTAVYRGTSAAQQPVVIKVMRQSHPDFSELVHFRNQYAITHNLSISGVVRPLCLEPWQNGYALVMEDFEGQSLQQYIAEQPLSLIEVLGVALQMTDILHGLNQHHVVHKDIKPANILIQPASKRIQLIDFSIATLLPKETQEIKNPNVLEGTLAYLAPEQTGRMNRGIDYRTDFYGLGVALYELLTGQVPFAATDPLELVHCHIAKTPLPAHEVNAAIPGMVSQIVLKLMAKNAEDRYQSALGLKHDLAHCLQVLKDTGEIAAFELGQRDISDRFLIPDKLYGREAEVQALLASFERTSQGKAEMMLVAGFSGVGKTAVVNEVHKPITRQQGYFVKGKFDQLNRNIPLSAFVQALRDLMKQLLSESDAQLAQWKSNILTALGENGQVLIDVIPELEQIIGKQPSAIALSGNAAQHRFNLLFPKFVEVFSTAAHPLVVFLDDLQWADLASLQLMKLLMNDNGYLLILGAYRDNEVSPTHPFMMTVEELKKTGATVNTMTLAPLTLSDTSRLIADTLHCSSQLAKPLIELVDRKTQGNPFFTTQFLRALYEDGHICFNRDRGCWECNITQVSELALTDDVVEFMVLQLQKLPIETQQVLKLAACIGNQFDLATLKIVSEQSLADVSAALWRVLQEGLILPTSQVYKFFQAPEPGDEQSSVNPTYRFLHDRVQQAAYALIPDHQKQQTHLTIGRLLWRNRSTSEYLFEILNHFNTSLELIDDPQERRSIIQLNLAGCQRAKAAIAYDAATQYAHIAISLLPTDAWELEYALTLEIYEAAAETAYLNTEFSASEILIQTILQHSNRVIDCVKSYDLLICSYSAKDEHVKAIEIGLEALAKLKVPLIEQADWQEQLPSLPRFADLDSCETMTQPEYLAALKILITITPAAHHGKPEIFPAVVSTMLALCNRAGYSELAAYVYGIYGLLLCAVIGDFETAHRSGQLSLRLLEKYQARTLRTKVNLLFAVFVCACKDAGQDTLPLLKQGIEAGLEVGDIEYVSYCIMANFSHLFLLGQPLDSIKGSQQQYLPILKQFKQEHCIEYSKIWLQIANEFINGSELQQATADQADSVIRFEQSNNQQRLFAFHVAQLISCYTFGRHNRAVEHAIRALDSQEAAFGVLLTSAHTFYHSLALLAEIAAPSTSLKCQAAMEKVLANQTKMQQLAEHAPGNYQHKWDLIAAEIYRVQDRKSAAIDAYDRAIDGAKANGYLQEAALANELAAKFYLGWGKEIVATAYMQQAYYDYARWGAKAKTDALAQHYPTLLQPILQQVAQPAETFNPLETIIASQTSIHASTHASPQTTRTSTTNINTSLDLAAVLKASQALSSTIELEDLLRQLTQIVLQNSGGDRCALILADPSGTWQLKALATPSNTELCSDPLDGHSELPLKLIQYVKNTQKTVVIDNLETELPVIDDYLEQSKPQSLLCLPLLNQGKLLGILYLRNRNTRGAFTQERIHILGFLCTQAAISLENARLYQQAQTYAEQLEQSQLQTVQAEKMASLGNLVAGVAHEINNPIGFLNGSIRNAKSYVLDLESQLAIYRQHYPNPVESVQEKAEEIDLDFLLEDFPKLLDSMTAANQRIKSISTSLRTFSRADTEHKVSANLHEGLDSTLLILKYRLKGNEHRPEIKVVKDYGELPAVDCFPGQLNQVFMNLLANAIDIFDEAAEQSSFAEMKDTPQIITVKTEIGTGQNSEQKTVNIRIGDNGKGMPEAVKARIFDHLYTTKGVGKGTGLGLAIAQQIVVEKHGGSLTVQSELGQGTEFCIQLPF